MTEKNKQVIKKILCEIDNINILDNIDDFNRGYSVGLARALDIMIENELITYTDFLTLKRVRS